MGARSWLEASDRSVWLGKDEDEVKLERCTVQTSWGSVLRAVERCEQVSAGVV